MRLHILILIASVCAIGCSERNILDQPTMADDWYALTDVGFGWNYVIAGSNGVERNVDVIVRSNDSFEITINEYQIDAEPALLSKKKGRLPTDEAASLRNALSKLHVREGADFVKTMPNCPEWSHPNIEYYVGFETEQGPQVTILEKNCETPETLRGRTIIENAIKAFPQIDQEGLLSGSTEL